MLAGEPGIRKTRTAEELGVLAEHREPRSSGAGPMNRCYEEEGVPPYWPWVQAIRSYIREKDPEELRSVMGAGAEHIAEIVAGEEFGSMDITEPGAGSDMARLICKGEQDDDGNWFVSGQKIFITSGHGRYHFVIAQADAGEESVEGEPDVGRREFDRAERGRDDDGDDDPGE